MNIQIFGKPKCFDTKKAERYFKERKIKYQSIDVAKYGMSRGEFNSVKSAVGGLEKLIDGDSKDDDAVLLRYLAGAQAKEEKLLANPQLLKTPVVRNGKRATVGYQPEIWKTWE
ncbi:arsenate reductase family protein [Caproiciproducens sp. CPB-2]|uniref:arsenate reductase family protein n=1 Tax=Caproiciproducens sp. CPB-2 TaxID=3030017 RepID=UPI0023DB1ADC|nr:arsenate reductase family protein [Caproiciproducens sp. CPB-2]MDF1495943.1 arsenate reductase family protein [Caproiciproducens sp. CPB-2]